MRKLFLVAILISAFTTLAYAADGRPPSNVVVGKVSAGVLASTSPFVGTVVNNAILIVHQSLNNIREQGMDHREAVIDSVKTRIRPIYMSATTSLFGMLPLVLSPGSGSELYRGLGGVVLGGLALSTVFTVFLIPTMLMFVIKWEKKRGSDA